jgi:hypothetical protein
MRLKILDKPWSGKRLTALFVVSLLLFVVVRWQPGPWLRGSVINMAQQRGVRLDFQTMRLSGFTVHMRNVSIGLPGRSLALDSLEVSPDWAALLTGKKGLRVGLGWHGQTAEADLVVRKGYTEIRHFDTRLDIAALQPFWQRMLAFPLDVGGKLRIKGDVRLDTATGRPVGGALSADWQDAGVAMAGKRYPFGAYRLEIKDDRSPGEWQWKLSGGSAVSVQASGALQAFAANPAAWTLSGTGTARTGQGADPGLASLLGSAPIRLRLSGNLGMPRLQRL